MKLPVIQPHPALWCYASDLSAIELLLLCCVIPALSVAPECFLHAVSKMHVKRLFGIVRGFCSFWLEPGISACDAGCSSSCSYIPGSSTWSPLLQRL